MGDNEQRDSNTGTEIIEDRKCSVCDYSLRGLQTGMRCPECGQPIRKLEWDFGTRKAPNWFLPPTHAFITLFVFWWGWNRWTSLLLVGVLAGLGIGGALGAFIGTVATFILIGILANRQRHDAE